MVPNTFALKGGVLTSSHNKSRRKTGSVPYTRGEIDRWFDARIHPLTKEFPGLWLLDGALHAAVEQNLTQSLEKFVRYNVPKSWTSFASSSVGAAETPID